MKVLLVEHSKKLWPMFGKGVAQPIHLAYLAAVLEEDDIEVDILDCTALGLGWKDYVRVLERTSPEVVGVSGITPFLSSAVKAIQLAKEVNPDVVTVAGGTHFSLNARQSLIDYPEIDYIVRGEGEVTLLELVRALENGLSPSGVKGIAFRMEKDVRTTPERPLIEDLDSLPMPAYHKLPMDKYRFVVWGPDICIMISSRGCPFHCRFCTERKIWGNRWRGHSAHRLVDEMELLSTTYGVKTIWFGDDCFNLDRRRNIQFLEELEERKLDMKWYFEARVDTILRDADLISRMKELGLFHVLLGAESSSASDLRYLNKDITVEEIKKAVSLLKQHGVIAHTNFIVGLPTDTKETIRRTVEFAKELDPDIAVFVPLTPFPGTEIYDELTSSGLLTETDFSQFDFITPVVPTNTLSRRELQREIIRAYAHFYGRISKTIRGLSSRHAYAKETFFHMSRMMSTHLMIRYLFSDLSED